MELYLVVAIFSAIQSLFGIGLLAFGTPTLLLLNFNFEQALSVLLPCSIAISLMQSINFRKQLDVKSVGDFLKFAIVPMSLGLILAVSIDIKLFVKVFVGAVLIFSGAIKFIPKCLYSLQIYFDRHEGKCLTIIGLVHGLSNLGGGLLAALSQHKFKTQAQRLAWISTCYIMFAISQLLILILSGNYYIHDNYALIAVSFIVYLAFKAIFTNSINASKIGFMFFF